MIIYLDQNKWIDLAKAIVKPKEKPKENPKYIEVANLILDKVKNGDWIFPLSIIHVSETTSRAEMKSRERLVDVMIEISDGHSIKSFLEVQKEELQNTFLAICAPEKITQIQAIVKNPLIAIGAEKLSVDFKIDIPLNIRQELISFIDNNIKNDLSIRKIILNRHDKESVNALNNADEILTKEMERDRISLLKLRKKDRYITFLFQRFFALIKFCNIELETLIGKNILQKSTLDDKDKIFKLLEGAPSVNVATNLTYSLLKDKERPIQKHDNRDINFLSTAIPYCDVVITEKTWKHLAKTNKLDCKYSAKVENDLNYLLELA